MQRRCCEVCFNHLMPGENRSVGVMVCRECAEVHDMLYTIPFCRVDKRFALHEHVNCITSY
jgi:hypothetical protein